IGQGQSMIGDPLNALTWIVGPDAWSFDARYVALRIVFAVAVGLAVLLATENLAAAAIVAIAAPFITFWIFRVNHPAIFSLCYSPLILLAWMGLVYGRRRSRPWWIAALVVANWLEMNSGTVKEAYITM